MAKDTYHDPVTIKVNNIIGKVNSPVLTVEEYNRRMEVIKKASVRLVLSK